MPDPARVARASITAAERKGLSRPDAADAVLAVIGTVGEQVTGSDLDWMATRDNMAGWLRQIWLEAHRIKVATTRK